MIENVIATGKIASPGKGEGKIRKIGTEQVEEARGDYEKELREWVVEEYADAVAEDVLLTDELLPTLVPLARKADAVLTYRTTSLTSKAAVVAREHGTPCLVGLELAEDLKEGERIIVDADGDIDTRNRKEGRVLEQ